MALNESSSPGVDVEAGAVIGPTASRWTPTEADAIGTDRGSRGTAERPQRYGEFPLFDTPRQSASPDPVSILSHELISPLTLIKGYTATLLQLRDVITEDKQEQYLRGIEAATNRVIRLLEDLRDIARLEGPEALDVEPVSPGDLLRQTVADMQAQTTRHVLKLAPPMALPAVMADGAKVQQVLVNLLANAIKYSPQGGDIETAARLVRNELELWDTFGPVRGVRMPCLVMSVLDSGIGVPEAELERVFERFYRVKNAFTRTVPGAGLGLYISKVIIEAHGGRIWASNRDQGGSIFSFSLPLAPSPAGL